AASRGGGDDAAVGDVLAHPVVELLLGVGAVAPFGEMAPVHHPEVVHHPRDDEHVRELRAQAEVQLRGAPLLALAEVPGLLRGGGREEAGLVPVLAEGEADEALLREIVLAPLREDDLGWGPRPGLSPDFVLDERRTLDRASAQPADDVGAPAI